MDIHITHLKQIRSHFLAFLETYKVKQLTHIPKGFNNNIFWNIAHCMVTQQLLCYYLTENKMYVDDFWVSNFRKGTTPNIRVESNHIKELKEKLTVLPDYMLLDYNKGIFNKYEIYETSFGTTLSSVEDAIKFNNIHEGLHLGYVMALRKCL